MSFKLRSKLGSWLQEHRNRGGGANLCPCPNITLLPTPLVGCMIIIWDNECTSPIQSWQCLWNKVIVQDSSSPQFPNCCFVSTFLSLQGNMASWLQQKNRRNIIKSTCNTLTISSTTVHFSSLHASVQPSVSLFDQSHMVTVELDAWQFTSPWNIFCHPQYHDPVSINHYCIYMNLAIPWTAGHLYRH